MGTAPFPMTLRDLHRHSPIASLHANAIFRTRCAAVDYNSVEQSLWTAERLLQRGTPRKLAESDEMHVCVPCFQPINDNNNQVIHSPRPSVSDRYVYCTY